MSFAKTNWFIRLCWVGFLILHFSWASSAQTAATRVASNPTSLEKRAELNLQAAKANPLALRHFLLGMPKGADLHNHLGGAVYAESWIRIAAAEHLCINLADHSFLPRPPGLSSGSTAPTCGPGQLPADNAFKDQKLYDSLVDTFSMRGFVPSPGITGHDHFFSTFMKFQEASFYRMGEYLDEVTSRAASQNEQYLELMHTPSYPNTIAHALEIGWNDDLAVLREKLLKAGFAQDISTAKAELDEAGLVHRDREHCDKENPTPACQVQVRYLCQVLRGLPKEIVFAQTVFCFELASVDSRFVGINYVMPEDGYTSMADYNLQMRMVGYLHGVYPKIHISLHAGELAPGLVPYEDLCCHIRLAVDEAHAERIGHGVDIMYEDHPHELLRELAAKHIMVEINLTSNDVILGVAGKDHPLPIYRQFHVPVALSTDDEGVSRIDLTHEYVRAVQAYGFTYTDLKQMVRTGMEHTFLPGASVWAKPDEFAQPAAPCSHDVLGVEHPSKPCSEFLRTNEKAGAQWELERRFTAFETSL